MTDWTQYVGIPRLPHGRDRDGCDCWGLVRLVYASECGVALPSYAGEYVGLEERAEIARLIRDFRDAGPWRKVKGAPVPFDVLVFRVAGEGAHVGLAIDAARMLHVHRDHSKVELHDHRPWSTRLVGAWRHEALA